ncbi:MAG TPA: T9SS type A sorting domain-containing protein [Flavobacteriales bacterium]|nr:T9SS type A sorting domain-containing protein [Flavobacteriales bacterium]
MPLTLTRSLGVLMAAGLITFSAAAQSTVDIGLFRDHNTLEVRVRPSEDFNGVFSNLVFTIRWEAGGKSSLGELRQDPLPGQYIPLQPSGGVHEVGAYNYQVYAGFGMMDISEAGTSWKAGQEYTVARIPFRGNADFTLLNDQWTRQPLSNANYYASLGGYDRTGDIYTSLVEVKDQMPFSIQPNPTTGPVTITIPVAPGERMWYELVNSAGQVVFTEEAAAGSNGYRKHLDLSDKGAGVYYLRIHRDGDTESHRIVVNN